MFSTVTVAGLPIAATDLARASQHILEHAMSDGSNGIAIHLVNSYTVAIAQSDQDYARMLEASRWNLPDGRPISLFCRSKAAGARQVRGPALFKRILSSGVEHGTRHFFLGSTPQTLAKLEAKARDLYPGIDIVGTDSPPFGVTGSGEFERRDQLVEESNAHIVWVGLGTPKQDWEVERLAAHHNKVFIAVGAAFDFLADPQSESPEWLSVVGLEWAFRLSTEPRRLWRRYLFGNVRFLHAALTKHGRS